jgi:hypothetical protein
MTNPVATSLWDVRTAHSAVATSLGSTRKEVDVGNGQFFAIFSQLIFGEVAEWLKAALC